MTLTGCAPDAYGLRSGDSVAAFPVLGEEQTERDQVTPLPETTLDADSTRYLGSDDGRSLYLGIDPEKQSVCLIATFDGDPDQETQACSQAVPTVATGQPVVTGSFGPGSPSYSLWNIQSIGAAEDAGWRRISDLLWTR
ncbi:hypothetical protein HQQ81_16235 [Microbacteriaceae bacterium VKM Ac-2854]|nr:hypothetical protein [Microbacteriaceae bacterium VKM Ac-2854]